MMMIVLMGLECKRGTVWRESEGGEGKREGTRG
jgi:hypothetical protein